MNIQKLINKAGFRKRNRLKNSDCCAICKKRPDHLRPLSKGVCGERLKIEGFTGCRKQGCRLRSMGLSPGDIVQILHKGDPVIIALDTTRLALASIMAQHVLTSTVPG
ncbi:MAG: ferrous iron transport protein A [Desulfobulbaceae bacterium]|nr:ferrous iron transport protein A [Desulfobulbaceae bacterium]